MTSECLGPERTEARLQVLMYGIKEHLRWAEETFHRDYPFKKLQELLEEIEDPRRRWFRP